MRKILWLLPLTACSAPTFQVDAPLAATRPIVVEGDGPLQTGCEKGDTLAAEKLRSGRHATIGAMTTWVAGTHREVVNQHLFGETVLRDLQRLLDVVSDVRRSVALAEAIANVPGATQAGADAAGQELPALGGDLSGVRQLLEMPRAVTETMVTTFASRIGDRALLSVCVSEDTMREFGTFDAARFTMRCRILADGTDNVRELSVRAGGTWADVTYGGELRGPADNNERATFASQSMRIVGVGVVRGFDLHEAGRQIAAISFYEQGASAPPPYVSRLWQLPGASTAWRDTVTHAMSIGQLFPWPNACDASQRRTR